INAQTGKQLKRITTMSGVESLSFGSKNMLWAWINNYGLAKIDITISSIDRVLARNVEIEDIMWSSDKTRIYAIQETNLRVYDQTNISKVCDLPANTKSLDKLSDNILLLGSYGKNIPIKLQAIDITTCKVVASKDIPTGTYDNITDIACMNIFGN
ncbi:MAG: hypothetical protein IMF12_01840, partial [Proteobacteria bacterium]|nr:hypothetical protein [Pseudomonadota bacterium]